MPDIDRPDAVTPALYSEPLLPIEKKLIAWSLGLGVTLLILLAAINAMLPAGP